ncbi:hypothetical protein BK654_08025 [Pseudomonas brassicacearum]|uniref:hypothetical protein n=1 Tax=Pseudomonas brassicacearum TaxID=930166 RepID=UPI000F493C28|nr:hypothetical protein [Pseudomonas brassicacearum]ROM79305.1 hypothetical protein BK654_08025 [Pseudomonas brassicacearum]
MNLAKPAEQLSNSYKRPSTEYNKHPNKKSTVLRNIAAYIILLVICAIIFTPLISTLSLNGGDYKLHLKWASDMESSHTLNLPHPLYHILVIIAKKLLTIDYTQSSTVVTVIFIYFLAILNLKILASHTSLAIAIFLSTCLLIVTPIQLFYFIDHHLYFGYIGISIYHSPTMLLLKPLSLLVFCCALKSVNSQTNKAWPGGVALALSLFFCGISKPNFLIVVLPAFVAFLLITNRLKNMLSHTYIYVWFFLPILTLLSLQFLQTFILQDISKVTNDSENHITIMPFETLAHYSEFLLAKLFLSIAFPLTILLLYPKQFIKDDSIILSSCCLFVGALFMYFFAESGSRIYHGNFWWSGQIGLYLVFLFSVAFLLRNKKDLKETKQGKIKYSLCFAMFFLHAAFGVFFYKQELFFNSKFW